MKIDFHTHGKLAKNLPFSAEYTRLLLREAKESGLDAICLTEHFNTIGFEEIYCYMLDTYERQEDCFLAEGVKVFPGMEIDIKEGGHILAVGTLEHVLSINRDLDKFKEKDKFMPFSDLLRVLKEYDMLTGAAHAFREGSHIPYLEKELLIKLDFADLNGKDYAVKKSQAYEEIKQFAAEHNLAVVAGSDTHQSFQYGCIWNEFEKDCATLEELKQIIKSGEYGIKILEYIDFKVKTAGILKKSLKKIHSLGGDYVSVMAV